MAAKRLIFVVVAGMLALSACTASVSTGEPHVYYHHYDDND